MVDSQNMTSGDYHTSVQVASGAFQREIDLVLSVADVVFPDQPDYSLVMWDYIATGAHRGITPANRAAAARDLADHFGNAPVTMGDWIPRPQSSDFDTQGNLRPSFDFSRWKKFVDLFPDARYYLAFLNLSHRDRFAGFSFGTDEWERAVGSWAKAFGRYMSSLDKDPSQLALYFADEPRSSENLETAAQYAKAVETAASEVTTFCTLNAQAGVTERGGER